MNNRMDEIRKAAEEKLRPQVEYAEEQVKSGLTAVAGQGAADLFDSLKAAAAEPHSGIVKLAVEPISRVENGATLTVVFADGSSASLSVWRGNNPPVRLDYYGVNQAPWFDNGPSWNTFNPKETPNWAEQVATRIFGQAYMNAQVIRGRDIVAIAQAAKLNAA